MNTEYVYLGQNEYLGDALKSKYGKDCIPSSVILDKTLTGIGATFTEIHTKRNSIIIEPNVPVIVGKCQKEGNCLGVYSETTVSQIKKYLNNDAIKYKKILTTPEGFKKIRKAAGNSYSQIQQTYFCLFDECEKLTQDCDYRANITQPVYDFFEFKEKAFVSATPLNVSHPEFENQNFIRLKVEPLFDYRMNLHLIVTNCYERTVREELERLKDSSCVCIFLNSVTGINALVNSLNLKDNSRIYCSEDGVKKLKECGFDNAVSSINYPLAKYNIFTSRFYSAVDIDLNVKPDILILTNLNQAHHTMVDPYTEAIQIQGRFRTKFEDGQTYNSLTHITNTRDLEVLSDEEVTQMIDEYTITYRELLQRYHSATDEARKKGLKQQLKTICEDYLLDERMNIDYFGIDNKYNEERVKRYYSSGESIRQAYEATEFFNVEYEERRQAVGEDDIFRIKYAPSEKVRIQRLAFALQQLDLQCSQNENINKSFFIDLLRNCYEYADLLIEMKEAVPFGFAHIASFGGASRKEIEKIVADSRNEKRRFSKEVIQDIYNVFQKHIGQKIAKEECKEIVGEIYKKHNILHNQKDIKAKVSQQTIGEYFKVAPQNSEKPNKWRIEYLLPQFNEALQE